MDLDPFPMIAFSPYGSGSVFDCIMDLDPYSVALWIRIRVLSVFDSLWIWICNEFVVDVLLDLYCIHIQ